MHGMTVYVTYRTLPYLGDRRMTVHMVQMGDHALWGFREEVSMLGH